MMRSKKRLTSSLVTFTIFLFLATASPAFAADKEKVLHNFGDEEDGASPNGGLIFDAAGNLYGTTYYGGGGNCGYDTTCGTVFQLTPSGNGKWKESVILLGSQAGDNPAAGLILDAAGNLYGTASGGYQGEGLGTVFELSPHANGKWTEEILYSFTNGDGGNDPVAGLTSDAAGNLYGTTFTSLYGCGNVFELVHGAKDTWTEKVLLTFGQGHGCYPDGTMIFDATGNLYGTASGGGHYKDHCTYGCGAVFELIPGPKRNWTAKMLHLFTGKDGISPSGNLLFDRTGSLYGTTSGGGQYGRGAVFEMAPQSNGPWKEKLLYSFNGIDGAEPAGLIFDATGNLYGTTQYGGASGPRCSAYGCGTAFKLTPGANGKWKEKVLHIFGSGEDGYLPEGGLIFDKAGNLYGSTASGGSFDGGTVFEITPLEEEASTRRKR
jgi:uncharacterized repeat protein (TIGR03803 family)